MRLLFILLLPLALSAQTSVIFDTDFGPDYDDAGAITMLHAFADSGYIKILAAMASSKHKNAAAAISLFNDYFNRPDVPIGVVRGNAVALGDKQHWTDSVMAHYPHHLNNNEEAYDALYLYRRILAAQPDHSVTIITVGFLTNLANLLNSPADSISSMNGYELVSRKVKSIVSMGGRFPEGYEFNLKEDIPSTRKVLNDWPTPILFSGFEIGVKIKTGLPLIQDNKIRHSPVKDVFSICIPLAAEDSLGRSSWDESAVFVAVKGGDPYFAMENGTCTLGNDGKNAWQPGAGRHRRLIEKMPSVEMSRIFNQLILHQPVQPDSCPPNNLWYYNTGAKYPESPDSLLSRLHRQPSTIKPQPNDQSGYINFRFVIDCNGKINGPIEILVMDEQYKAVQFDKKLVTYLQNFLLSLHAWKKVTYRSVKYSYHSFMSFKIKHGKVIRIIP